MIKYSDWHNCYDLPWKGLLYEDKESGESAFSHPAKMARGLVFRIVEYALQNGFVQPGSTVVDCFGGVGTTGLPCLMNGLNYIGVELEPAFVSLAQKNIALWNAKFSSMPKWTGQARIIQGDSRHLAEIIGAAGLVVSSPPYAVDQMGGGGNNANLGISNVSMKAGYGSTNGQLANLPPGDISAIIASPSWAGNSGGQGEASRNGIDPALFDRHQGGMKKGTGDNPANLDHLPMGEPPTLIISSPPYAESLKPETEEQTQRKQARIAKSKSLYDGRAIESPSAGKAALDGGYGTSDGQLSAMVIGSPPFAGSIGSDDPAKRGGILTSDPRRAGDTNLTGSYGESEGQLGAMVVGSPPYEGTPIASGSNGRYGDHTEKIDLNKQMGYGVGYGQTPNQLGNDSGETFWAASRTILTQCHQILPEGGAAIWVVKNYVKGGQIVPFSEQWQALCEACGFETVEIIRAMLVKKNGAQAGLDGQMVSKDKARKSFFRRLAEAKGSPPIDFETVLITRKRQGLG